MVFQEGHQRPERRFARRIVQYLAAVMRYQWMNRKTYITRFLSYTIITHYTTITQDVYKCNVMNVERVIVLIKQRKDTVEYRNVRLSIETYTKLDKYLLELIQKRSDRRLSLDDAINSLIEDYYSKITRD